MDSPDRPNIVFIMADDHAAHAMSCYGSRINRTPNIDRIAEGGIILQNCFCTNSICTPSRASILTGKYSHLNGVKTLGDKLDGRQQTVAKLLQAGGYQTAMIGKWHLGHGGLHDPTGFDYWNVLPGQGLYHDPEMIELGERKVHEGYVTDIITDLSIEWLKDRDPESPFFLMCHHKAPHRPWDPDAKHARMYEDIEIPEPETFNDDYRNRSRAAKEAKMRIDRDLNARDLKVESPSGLRGQALKRWKYQRYIKDYLRCVASIDDNVGRLLDFLDEERQTENTVVIYTSDQGFFLGDHGWYDKRFFYEEIVADAVCRALSGRDSARRQLPGDGPQCRFRADLPRLCRLAGPGGDAGLEPSDRSSAVRGLAAGGSQSTIDTGCISLTTMSVHTYGIRTHRYKLIYYYGEALGTTNSIDESRSRNGNCLTSKEIRRSGIMFTTPPPTPMLSSH